MNYQKKLCILKQLSSGFAEDGKKVSALLTAEKLGGTLTLSLALIGFAPLREGRYVCLFCDEKGIRHQFFVTPPSGQLRCASEADISSGFCCLVCFAGANVTPVAFGKCGERTYDVKKLCGLIADEYLSPARPAEPREESDGAAREETDRGKGDALPEPYDDEVVATENYYEFDEVKDEMPFVAPQGAGDAGADEDGARLCERALAGEDGADAPAGKAAASAETGGDPRYYTKVKRELSALFERYPPEEELAECIPYSRWVRIAFGKDKYYTVGVIFDETRAKYICYGVPAERFGEAPAALKGMCSFLPLSVFDLRGRGYWMMFQDADTGKCIKIQ